MKKILLILLFIAVSLAVSFAAKSSPESLSTSEIKLINEFASKIQRTKEFADGCLNEITVFESEGFYCEKFERKNRVILFYHSQITKQHKLNLKRLNNFIANDTKLSKEFDGFYDIVEISRKIDCKINKIYRNKVSSINCKFKAEM